MPETNAFSENTTKDYFKKEKFVLKVLGTPVADNVGVGYKIYSFVLLYVVIFPYPLLAFADLFKHEFDVVADLLVSDTGAVLSSVMNWHVLRNRLKLHRLLNKLEKEPFTVNFERGGEEEEQLVKKWLAFQKIQGVLFYVSTTGTIVSAFASTIFARIKNNDPSKWLFPFGPLTLLNVTYSPNYEISALYQNLAFSHFSYSATAIILMVAGILAYASVQFKILQNNLRRIVFNSYQEMLKDKNLANETCADSSEAEAVIVPSKIPWKYLKISLKKAVMYHTSIIEIVMEIEEMFSSLLLCIYICFLALLSCQVYRASLIPLNDTRILRRLNEACTLLFMPLLTCYWGEEVAQQSQQVGKAVYEADFVGTDLRFQKGINIIANRSQKNARIKAGKFIEVSVITFAWILRTSYSAFMVVRRMNTDK